MNNKNIGILDPNGIKNNPLTGKPYENLYQNANNKPGTYQDFAKKWTQLPVYGKKEEFIKAIKDNQILLVDSGTGSGKTVLVPKFALHATKYEKKIAVTIPKQVIVKSNALWAAKCLDVKIGQEVGYKYRGSPSSAKSKDTKLLFTTDGTIVAQLMNDIKLPQYDIVIIDEAHERNIQIDFLMLLLKETLRLRPEFKLIIMSATIDVDKYKNYYANEFKFQHIYAGEQPNFPIEDIYLDKPIEFNKVFDKSIEKVVEILEETDDGDILVFVKSGPEAKKGCRSLEKEIKKRPPFCTELFSGVSKEKEDLATSAVLFKQQTNRNGKTFERKVVFSTNVAESSLTVENVKFVIENGIELQDSYDPLKMMDKLYTTRISDANRKQRRGRTGRTSPGICYYMYTKKEMEAMSKFPLPAIQKTNLSQFYLRLFNLPHINNLQELINYVNQLIDKPDNSFTKSAIQILLGLGIIEITDKEPLNGKLTELGEKVVKYAGAMDPKNAVSMYYAYQNYVKTEVGLIVSMLEIAKGKIGEFLIPFNEDPSSTLPKKQQEKIYQQKKKNFVNQGGDFLSLLKVLKKFEDVRKKKGDDAALEWCIENNLQHKNLKKTWINYYQFIKEFMKVMRGEKELLEEDVVENTTVMSGGEAPESLKLVEDKILECFFKGYVIQYAKPYGLGKSYMNCFPEESSVGDIDKDSLYQMIKTKPKHMFYGLLQDLDGKVSYAFVNKIPQKVLDRLSKKEKDIMELCKLRAKNVKNKKNEKK